jgi:hypothetical protein
MPNAESLAAISQGRIIKMYDQRATPGDNYKLPAFLRSDFDVGGATSARAMTNPKC